MSQLPDSQTSPHHHQWLPLPLLDAFRPRVTVKRREDDRNSGLANLTASLTMDALLNYGKTFSDEEISTTFQDILTDNGTGLPELPKFPNYSDDVIPMCPEEKSKCIKCKKGDNEKPLVECHDCEKRYHFNCHRPPVTEADLMDPRMIWYCAECSLAHKLSIRPPVKKNEGKKESLKLTFCKYNSGVPLKNEKGEWVKGGSWTTQSRREPLKSPQELFPSLMSAAAAVEPVAFQRKNTEPIRVDRRKTTPTGQPAGLAAWAAKLRAAKIAKKEKSKAPETVVRSHEEEESENVDADSSCGGIIVEPEPIVTEKRAKRKRMDKRLEDLLADAKTLLGDAVETTPDEKRRTRSQSARAVATDKLVEKTDTDLESTDLVSSNNGDAYALDSGSYRPEYIPAIPVKPTRSRGSAQKSVKKQLKLTINLTEEKVSFQEKEEPILKKPKKAKKKSEKRSSKRKNKESGSSMPKLASQVPIPRNSVNYEEKSSDGEEMETPQNMMPITGLTL